MKNILSYQDKTPFSGKDILIWCNYQILNSTKSAKQARKILKLYGNIKPESYYWFVNISKFLKRTSLIRLENVN